LKAAIELSFDTDSPELPSDEILSLMRNAACAASRINGFGDVEISLMFVPPEGIHALNLEYRGVDDVTDVLSFPQSDGRIPDVSNAGRSKRSASGSSYQIAPVLLGDIVICTERVLEQADEYGHSAAREFVYLFVHGLLHLLGYDHGADDERAAMRGIEEQIMGEVGL
jgi:probable rRNA maturation factor